MSQAEGRQNFLRFNTQYFTADCDMEPVAPAVYVDKQALQQYRHLCREISELEQEKEAIAQGGPGSSWQTEPRVSGGRQADTTAETAHQLWRLSQLIAQRLNSLIDLRQEIEQVISLLSPEERRLLRLFYIQSRPAAECACLLQYSERHFWRRHQQALKRLAEVQGSEPASQPRFGAPPQPQPA